PSLEVFCDKRVVAQMGVISPYADDLRQLPRTKPFFGDETPDPGQQPLTAERFVDARNHALKPVVHVEERGVYIGPLVRERPHLLGNGLARMPPRLQLLKLLDDDAGEAGPLAQKSAHEADRTDVVSRRELGLADEVEEDMVVVAGVEGDLVRAARSGQRSHHVERLIPIERGDLDRYDRFQLEEAAPKGVIEPPTAHRRL